MVGRFYLVNARFGTSGPEPADQRITASSRNQPRNEAFIAQR